MTTTAHPTLGETTLRLWNGLPLLWKVMIPAVGVLLVVLLPANLLISAQFYAINTANLRAQHQAVLGAIGATFDEFITSQAASVTTLANSNSVAACAPTGCTAEASSLFGAELSAKLNDATTYYTEIGFMDPQGKETARALRGSGGIVAVPGDAPLFSADPAALQQTPAGQGYVFPITRDTRLAATEAYQQPVLRLAAPVVVANERKGYVTSVVGLDDFFAQNFVYSSQHETILLDTNKCLLASSDVTRRAELYKTWSGNPARTCYADMPLEDWDTTVQRYGNTIISSHVIHGALSTSGQTWTLVVQEPASLAYDQANTMRTLLVGANAVTIILVAALIVAVDRASRRMLSLAQRRNVDHARDIRFNPYVVGSPVEDKHRFFGRTGVLAQVIGAGMLGGDDVLIDGDRRIGKSSLLRQVVRRLRERQLSDPTYRYWPIMFSLQGVTAEIFYATLMDHILQDVEDRVTEMDLRYHRRSGPYGVEDFREDIVEVLALPLSSGQQTRLVLCLDNIHLWFDGAAGYDQAYVETFRDMLARVGNQLKLIATGTRIPADVFGPSITVITLGPLERDEAERLIRQPVAEYYPFSAEAVERIMQDSDRLPMELQRLAHHAVQIMLEQDAETISLTHAEGARQRALADWEPTYRLLWYGGTDKRGTLTGRFSDPVRAALLTIASRDLPISPELWSGDAPLVARSQLDDIAYTDAEGTVRLTTLFKAWLAHTAR